MSALNAAKTAMEKTSQNTKDQTAHLKRWPFTYMWTALDVSNFLRDVGFSKYSKCFTDNLINGRNIKDLSVFDLQRLGVDNMMDAIRIHAYLQKMSKKVHYNFNSPNEPPNISYMNVATSQFSGPSYSRFPPVTKPECMELSINDYRLPYRDQGSRYNRYNLTGPTFNYWRSICTRKDDEWSYTIDD